jgi:hypothetical protein
VKVEDANGRIESMEGERTRKKPRRIKKDILKTDILEKTPKIEKSFSYANLHHCFSPLIFSSIKKEDKE